MKKQLISLLTVGSLLFSAWTALPVCAQETDNTVSIDIVHTNDMHGYAQYQADSCVGMEMLQSIIREENPDLILDAGDTFHGQVFATIEEGESIAELMDSIGYDAMTPGNHDWNYGKERLKELDELHTAPVLAANVLDSNGEAYFDTPFIVQEVDGVKVGVFGVFDPSISNSTAPENVAGLMFADDVACANEMAAQLREEENCDVVIALTHRTDCGGFVAKTSGIDLVIAGHEHQVYDARYPDADGEEVAVVEAGYYMNNIGMVTLTYDKTAQDVTAVEENFLSASDVTAAVNAGALTADAEMSTQIAVIQARQNEVLDQVIGTSAEALDYTWETVRCDELPIGRVVTASYLQETGADIAIENAGGIRAGLPQGDVTYGDVVSVSPFGNYMVTKQISGQDLLDVLETSIEIGVQNKVVYDEQLAAIEAGEDPYQYTWPDNSGSYLQFGGIQVEYDVNKAQGERVQSVMVGGEALDLEKLYTVVTNNYVATSSDYPALANAPELYEYSACEEAIIDFVQLGEDVLSQAANTPNLVAVSADDPSSEPASSDASSSASDGSSQSSSGETSEVSSSTSSTTSAGSAGTPKTGDASNGWMLIVPMTAAGALGAVLLRKRQSDQ